jgi:hypothetical protein
MPEERGSSNNDGLRSLRLRAETMGVTCECALPYELARTSTCGGSTWMGGGGSRGRISAVRVSDTSIVVAAAGPGMREKQRAETKQRRPPL